MSEKFNGLFSEANQDTTSSSTRSLAGTAQLTTTASLVANDIIKLINDNYEEYKERVPASKSDHSAMDDLVLEAYDFNTIDVDFIKELDDTTVDNMLKSQQSKRSRSKGKVMTIDNYRTMMIGAIAENMLRLATGKEKHAGGSRRMAGVVEYTDEMLAELKDDQEQLRKEIRNVQSKKSIMKSKEGFSEQDERWEKLLIAESQLKELRGDTVRTIRVDETKDGLTEILSDVNFDEMKPAEAKKLLEKAAALIAENKEEQDESNV